MASERAKIAKDKGNAAFKAADYPTAIGHYTEAIIADSSDYTFFLNRAAAYLKLEKPEDAERDCTKVLALNSNNVKALFRRGQARRALGNLEDAQADLDRALALEPTNESVKKELLELEKLSNLQKLKQRPKLVALDSRIEVTTPKRRRVPIDIIEADTRPSEETRIVTPPGINDTDLLQPVSSRPLKNESMSTTTQTPLLKQRTFVDAKRAREEPKPTKVSGGIFRHTGNHTIISRTQSGTAPSIQTHNSPSHSTHRDASSARPPNPPTTLFQFTKSWDCQQSYTDKWNLIHAITPSSIPALFQSSLDPELLKSILCTFQVVLETDPTPNTRNAIRDYLLAFTKVQRFGTVMLFMDKEDRQLFEMLHKKVNSVHP